MVLLLCCLCKVCSCIYVRFGYYSLDLAKGEVLVWKTKLFVGFVFFLCVFTEVKWPVVSFFPLGFFTGFYIPCFFVSWNFLWFFCGLIFECLKIFMENLASDFWENFLGLLLFLPWKIWFNFFSWWFFWIFFSDDYFLGLEKMVEKFLVIFLRSNFFCLNFWSWIFGCGKNFFWFFWVEKMG